MYFSSCLSLNLTNFLSSAQKRHYNSFSQGKNLRNKTLAKAIPPVWNYDRRREKKLNIKNVGTKVKTNLFSKSKENQSEYEVMLLASHGPWIT